MCQFVPKFLNSVSVKYYLNWFIVGRVIAKVNKGELFLLRHRVYTLRYAVSAVLLFIGRNMVGVLADKPTDPFMMHIASVDHFDNKSAFATGNFFHTFNGGGVRSADTLFTIVIKRPAIVPYGAVRMFDGRIGKHFLCSHLLFHSSNSSGLRLKEKTDNRKIVIIRN